MYRSVLMLTGVAMLDKLLTTLKSLVKMPPVIQPENFGHPLALKTEWTPLKPGGTNIQTHHLVQVNALRWEFQPTSGALFFCGIFMTVGMIPIGIGLAQLLQTKAINPEMVGPMLVGLVFCAIGFFLLRSLRKPIVFDRQFGLYWKGVVDPMVQLQDAIAGRQAKSRAAVSLAEIGALQLISEYISGKTSYHSYELNLVLKDGRRVNVVDHGSLMALRQEATELSAFLSVPLWDACHLESGRGPT